MPWNPVITNIITESLLDVELSDYVRKTDNVTALGNKLDKINGVAENLKLAGGSVADTDAASVLYVNTSVGTVSTSISGKANKIGDTFTGNIVIPNGTLQTHAVNLSQLQLYLPLGGGILTGQVKTSLDPVAQEDLTNKRYVDTGLAIKASKDYVDGELVALENIVQDNYVTKDNGTFNGVAHGFTPLIANGDELATAFFVRELIDNAIGPTTFGTFASDESVDAKLDLFASKHGAELSNVTVIDELPLDEDSAKIATTAWVQALINDRLGTL